MHETQIDLVKDEFGGNKVLVRGEPMDAEKYTRLKKAEAEASREEARIEGEQRQAMRQLREEFGCASLEDAKQKLVELREEQTRWEAKFDELYKEFDQFIRDAEKDRRVEETPVEKDTGTRSSQSRRA